MIVARLPDPTTAPLLRAALRRAARPDEDVVWDPARGDEALLRGFPRLVVHVGADAGHSSRSRPSSTSWHPSTPGPSRVPVLFVTGGMLRVWERERASIPVPPPRVDFVGRRLGRLVREHADPRVWVDRTLADLSRASGGPLPAPFRGLARRVLEFPSWYADLSALEGLTGLSRGALKARFRRRGMESPTVWLRRLRVIAAAHVLADPSVTTLDAGYRLGFADSGNFCRLVRDAGGVTPTEVRDPAGRVGLVFALARELVDPDVRTGWESLGPVFLTGAA